MPTINYETVFITEPEISNDQVDQLMNKIKQTVTASSGTLVGEDRWGRRRLAHPIQKHREGFYTVITFNAEPSIVSSLEHFFNVTDAVIRHMTIKVIKKNKKFAPRRERPAGAVEGGRPTGRSGGPSRSRPEFTPKPTTPTVAPEGPAPASEPASVPASAAAPSTATPTEGGTPA